MGKEKAFPEELLRPELMLSSPFWAGVIQGLSRPASLRLLPRLDLGSPCGIDPAAPGVRVGGREESVIDALFREKLSHPEKVLLIRVGDFYEFYGVDAVVAVEFTGLNPMGSSGLPKAGCPVANIQATADALTSAGFGVVVLEQADVPGRARKRRFVSQVLTPSSPVYTYDLRLDTKRDAAFSDSSPVFGLSETVGGVTLVEVHPDMATTWVHEGLPEEAARARMERWGSRIGRVYLQENASTDALPAHLRAGGALASGLAQRVAGVGVMDFPRHVELLVKRDLNLAPETAFRLVREEMDKTASRPHPLFLGTATQIGLIPARGIPGILDSLLPRSSPETCRSILRDLLLSPPPARVASAIREGLAALAGLRQAIPEYRVSAPARFVKTIQCREASPTILRDLRHVADAYLASSEGPLAAAASHAGRVVEHLVGYAARDVLETARLVSETISHAVPGEDEQDAAPPPGSALIPGGLFTDLEEGFRGRVRQDASSEMRDAYRAVDLAREAYAEAISEDLLPLLAVGDAQGTGRGKRVPPSLCYDSENSAIWLNRSPEAAQNTLLIHPSDRHGKRLADRFSTARVEERLQAYKEATLAARAVASRVLREVSERLDPMIPEIVHMTVFGNLMRTLVLHLAEGLGRGWSLNIEPKDEGTIEIEEFFPYWLPRERSVLNTLSLGGMAILTGPNAGGKSTLIRSLLAACLLGSAGLMIPARRLALPFIDGFYIRTGAQDDPASGLSAFQVELLEITQQLRHATRRSLLMVDEVGKGTESRHGAALAGAILETLSHERGARGLFATHWHELWDIPVRLDGIRELQMEVLSAKLTHRVIPGRSGESLALEAASRVGLPHEIIRRAAEIAGEAASPSVRGEAHPPPSLSAARGVLSAETGVCGEEIRTIDARSEPPPGDSGRSILYVLRTPAGYFYVGETDDIRERLAAHRSSPEKKGAEAIYAPIPDGKSAARRLEAALIRRLSGLGYPLISTADASHVEFGTRAGGNT